MPDFHDIEHDALKAGLDAGPLVLVAVREPHDYAMGRIPGAILNPLSRFDPAALPVGQGKRVVLACAAGVRSFHALQQAQAAGVAVDTHYRPGFKGWAMAGEAIERDG